ncbi:class I SAM-dependent DNA methyltransferase [Patescibacteria group bacterium]
MNQQEIQKIINQTQKFYDTVAPSFSATRQKPWRGWDRALEHIKKLENPKILDLGCGNGRFYDFLSQNLRTSFSYTGLEINDVLLAEARGKYQNGNFQKHDIFIHLDKITKKYDIIVAFGITHHIPDMEFRKNWFSTLPKILSPGGLLIFTIWDFSKDKRFKNRAVKAKSLGEDDYLYNWGNVSEKRYFHKYNKEEMLLLREILQEGGLKLVENYLSDGKGNNLNNYFIYALLP